MRKLLFGILIAVLLMSAVVVTPAVGLAEERFAVLQAKREPLKIWKPLPVKGSKTLFALQGEGLYAGLAARLEKWMSGEETQGQARSAFHGKTVFGKARAMIAAVSSFGSAGGGAKPHEVAGIDERGYIRIPLELLMDAEDQDEAIMQELIALLPQSPGMSAIICAILDNGRAENGTGAREVFGRVMRSRKMIAEAVRMAQQEPEVFMRAHKMARLILETSSASFSRVQAQHDGRMQWLDGHSANVPGKIFKTLRLEHTTFTTQQRRVAHFQCYTDDKCLYIMGMLRNCKVLGRNLNILDPDA